MRLRRNVLPISAALMLAGCPSPRSGEPTGDPGYPEVAVLGGLAALDHGGKGWVAGDTHVHSLESTDARRHATPERIRERALAEGLRWVVITDHSNATGSRPYCLEDPSPNDCVEQPHLHNLGPEFPLWDALAALTDDAFVMVNGNEASPVDMDGLSARGHVNVVPLDLESFPTDWIIMDRPSGEVAGGWAVEAAREHGAYAIVNHPYTPGGIGPWIEYDWSSRDYDALEVYSGVAGYNEGDHAGWLAALCDWSQGRHVALIGASDNHDPDIEPPGELLGAELGGARTSVLVESLSWPAIAEALKARRTIAHDKHTFVEIRATVDGTVLLPGDVHPLAAPRTVAVEVAGWTDHPGDFITVIAVPDGSCEDPRAPGVGGNRARVTVDYMELAALRLTAPPPELGGTEPDRRRFEVEISPGTTLAAFVDREWGFIEERGQALPTPIRFAPAP